MSVKEFFHYRELMEELAPSPIELSFIIASHSKLFSTSNGDEELFNWVWSSGLDGFLLSVKANTQFIHLAAVISSLEEKVHENRLS